MAVLNRPQRLFSLALALAFVLAAGAAPARADDDVPGGRVDIEIPVLVETTPGKTEPEQEIDESLLVRASAKRLETVMETAAIVTVLSRDDLRERGYRTLADVLEEIPGFEAYRSVMLWGRRQPMARGAARTILVLWNGVPIVSPHSNLNSMWADLPMDMIRRVEIVSGPGGVLWGANAFLGIVNVVTERGDEDEPRSEARMTVGGGPGNQDAFGASATARESFLNGRLRMLAHVTLWTSKDAALNMPYDMQFAPFPGSPDGAITLNYSTGPIETRRDVCLPIAFNADYDLEHSSLQFDFLGDYYCDQREEVDPRGIRTDHYIDPNTGERYEGGASIRTYKSTVAQLVWRKPFGLKNHLTARLYSVGIMKDYSDEVIAPAGQFGDAAIIANYEYGGTNPVLNDGAYRYGANVETDVDLPRQNLITGVETMFEGRRNWIVRGAGTDIITIYKDGVLVSPEQRLVLAGYANDRIRLLDRLTLEGGLRVQAAVGDAPVEYSPVVLPSGTLVWNPAGKTYLKLNVSAGFRPPTVSQGVIASDNVASTYLGVGQKLVPERSRAAEAEISTVLLEHVRAVRRVHLRLGYQLSELSDLVLGRTGDLRNSGTRIVHTVETRADVRFSGGHRLILAGHFFTGSDSEIGPIRNVANFKLHLAADAVFTRKLRGMAALTVLGAREDLDRLPMAAESSAVDLVMPAGSVVIDRTEPVALLRAGIRAVDLWGDRFELGAYVENAFDDQANVPDTDWAKRENPFPQAMPGRSFYVSLIGTL